MEVLLVTGAVLIGVVDTIAAVVVSVRQFRRFGAPDDPVILRME